MTNEELIDKIKAEIERRLKKYATDVTMQLEALGKVILELKGILSFLSTIEESEKPVPNDLEEAAEKYAYMGVPDEMKSYVKSIGDEVIKNFIAGAEWDRSQMMKEAVEGDYDCQYMTPAVFLDKYLDGIKDGDKVRVIILKKED